MLVNGKSYGGSLEDPEEFQAFVTQAASESSLDADPPQATPTPTPAP